MAQPNGVPYGSNPQMANNPQLLAAQQPQNRVTISGISGLTNEVQTGATSGNPGTFNSAAPTTYDPYPTQVASAQQQQVFNNYTAPQSSQQSSSSMFGINSPQYSR
jgi:hypothetical protein